MCQAGQTGALATVTAVEGSSYRRPGARMLVAADGRSWGTVSGGCLERDVCRRARIVIDTGQCDVCCYETADSDDDALPPGEPGVSLGCGGRIDVLIQPVSRERPGPMEALAAVLRERCPAIMATVVRTGDSPGIQTGQQVVRYQHHIQQGISDTKVLAALAEDLAYDGPRHLLRRYPTSNSGWADVMIERFVPPQSLVILGDGRDAQPLVEIAKTLGWHVTLIGRRSVAELLTQFPLADVLACGDDDKPMANVAIEEGAAAVLMNHHFARDSDCLVHILKHPPRYVGILGPRHRTRKLLADARATNLPPDIAGRIYWPIGLDLGAHNPEQIAMAIVAEIQGVLADRPGGSLRERKGPIHTDVPRPAKTASKSWRP
jgi:xanthine/CO dehydrogenase XdhC/CoxF family maturation factor